MNTCWAHVSCYVNFALAIMKYMKMVLIRVASITEESKPQWYSAQSLPKPCFPSCIKTKLNAYPSCLVHALFSKLYQNA